MFSSKGMSDEIEKTESVYFDMNEDKRYANATKSNNNGNSSNDNRANNGTARAHTRRNASGEADDVSLPLHKLWFGGTLYRYSVTRCWNKK